MKKYLHEYIEKIDNLLKENKKITNDIIQKHLIKIGFFQHERLIHLLVTLFYAFIAIVFLLLGFVHYVFFLISSIVLTFLMFYIVHYFRLENGVQYLYKQYDIMLEKQNNLTKK